MIPANPTPTVEGLARDLTFFGTDRGVCVRVAGEGRPPGVCVLMLSMKAMNEVGPFLNQWKTRLKPVPPQTYIVAEPTANFRIVMETMQERGVEWLWQRPKLRDQTVLVAFIVSDQLDDAFAAELTRLHCPCKLK